MGDTISTLAPADPGYPVQLRQAAYPVPLPTLWLTGNTRILDMQLVGFLCSRRCPGDVIPRTLDLARMLREAAIPLLGGFHAPLEKEWPGHPAARQSASGDQPGTGNQRDADTEVLAEAPY